MTPSLLERKPRKLQGDQIAEVSKRGRERCLTLVETRRELWEKALPLMRSPVKRRRHIRRRGKGLEYIFCGRVGSAECFVFISIATGATVHTSRPEASTEAGLTLHAPATKGTGEFRRVTAHWHTGTLAMRDACADAWSPYPSSLNCQEKCPPPGLVKSRLRAPFFPSLGE